MVRNFGIAKTEKRCIENVAYGKWNTLCRNVNFSSISMIFGLVVEIDILNNIFPIYIFEIFAINCQYHYSGFCL